MISAKYPGQKMLDIEPTSTKEKKTWNKPIKNHHSHSPATLRQRLKRLWRRFCRCGRGESLSGLDEAALLRQLGAMAQHGRGKGLGTPGESHGFEVLPTLFTY